MSEAYVAEMNRRVEIFIHQGFERADEVLEAAGISVNTIQSKCSSSDDEQMLIQLIQRKGPAGFDRLDQVMKAFQISQLPDCVKEKINRMSEQNAKFDRVVNGDFVVLRLATVRTLGATCFCV